MLVWGLRFGNPAMQRHAKQAKRFGTPLPDGYSDEPVLFVGSELYYDAFHELDADRQRGFGLGPIPWSSMAKYCEFYRFDNTQTDLLFTYLTKMDEAYLQHTAKEDKRKNAVNSKKA